MTPEELATSVLVGFEECQTPISWAKERAALHARIAAAIREAEERGGTAALFSAPKANVSLEMVGGKSVLRISIGRRTDYVPASDIGLPTGHVITDDGVVRKVLGTLPMTADGCVVGNHAKLWVNDAGEVVSLRVDNIGCTDGDGMDEAFFEAGACYSTREAAKAARKGT